MTFDPVIFCLTVVILGAIATALTPRKEG